MPLGETLPSWLLTIWESKLHGARSPLALTICKAEIPAHTFLSHRLLIYFRLSF